MEKNLRLSLKSPDYPPEEKKKKKASEDISITSQTVLRLAETKKSAFKEPKEFEENHLRQC